MKLAIDFGTTNTVIARWNGRIPEIVSVPDLSIKSDRLPALVPSLVYVKDGPAREVIIGQAVRDGGFDHQPDNRLFRNFKRGIIAQPAPQPRQIDGIGWGDRDAAETFLHCLMTSLPLNLDEIDQLVLTAPVAAFESYLAWLSDAIGDLAAERVYTVDESTAAALGYAVTEPGAPVLVFDFGGGSLDLSLVQLPENRASTGGPLSFLRRSGSGGNTARVIAKAGQVLGGSDIDQWILTWALDQLQLSSVELGNGYASALSRCEQAKIRLSTEEDVSIQVETGADIRSVDLTRVALEGLLEKHGFYDALRHIVDKVMHVAHRTGIFKEDVKHVLLVGGVSLMPSVQAVLRQYFGDATVRGDKPFTAVVEGALQVVAGYGLDDYLGQGYGLRYFDAESGGHRYEEIIPMGSRYPSASPVEVMLGAAHQKQESIEFVIGEIGSEAMAQIEVRYEGGQSVFVAQTERTGQQIIPLNIDQAEQSLAYLKPVGSPGEARIQAQFTVDTERRLHLSAHDLKTRQALIPDTVIATLGKPAAGDNANAQSITAREPLLTNAQRQGYRRLSLRGITAMLNGLPSQTISLEAAEAALRSPSFQARYGAANALSKRADREARQVMQRVLAEGTAPARASAARHLHGFTWFAAEPLLRQALGDTDSRVREAAIYALCELREMDAYRLMSEALVQEVDAVREAAAYALRDCQDPAAVPVLKAVLLAADPAVRVKALEALSVNDTRQAVPVVRSALRDSSPEVIYAATLSLLELVHENCLDELAALIVESEGFARQSVVHALFHATNYLNVQITGHPAEGKVIDALQLTLGDKSAFVRKAALWPLAWIHTDRTAAMLKSAYANEQDSELKAYIVRVAVSLMSTVGEDLLQDACQSDDSVLRSAADQLIAERTQTGSVARFDETAFHGTGFRKASKGQ